MKKLLGTAIVVSSLALCAASAVVALEPSRSLGKVKSVAEDGSGFELKGKKTVRVELDGATELVKLATDETLGALQGGTKVHILGRKMPEYRNPDDGKLEAPDRIEQIQIIVAGDGFAPPPVPDALAKKGLEWIVGATAKRGVETLVDDHVLFYGRDKAVVTHGKLEAADIAKGMPVLVAGEQTGKGKDAVLKATKVTALLGAIKATDLPLIIGAE